MRLGDRVTPLESETVLDNDYPVHWDYVYIVDGVLVRSDVQGTVRDLKRDRNGLEVRRYDMAKRIEESQKETV